MSVRLHRGCDPGNTSAWLFGSTLALHSIEVCAARIVACLAMGISLPRGMAAFLKEENNLFRLRAEACDLRWLVFVVSGPVVAPIELVRTPTLRDLLINAWTHIAQRLLA